MRGAVVAVALLAAVATAALSQAAPAPPGHDALVLRLTDIGEGYRVGDDSGCGGLGIENAPQSVARIVLAYRPKGCAMDFERLWSDPRGTPAKGARVVESIAYVFPHADAAAAAMRIGPDFARYVLLDPSGLRPGPPPLALGDETAAFAAGRHFTVLWRRGAVVALVHVNGRGPRTAKLAGTSLARLQDRRIEKPAPVPAGANYDLEVDIEDPRLRVPVHWLGRRFAPAGLPRLALEDTSVIRQPEEGFEMAATISYAGRNAAVTLDLWRPGRWTRFMRSGLGRRGSWSSACARRRVVPLRRGRAEIFGGYAPRAGSPPRPVASAACPRRRPDDFIAHVYLPRVVVAVNMPNCLRCDTESGRYESFRALTAVARGLRLRPR